MPNQQLPDKKQIFLLFFARELIKNSREAVSELQKILEEEQQNGRAISEKTEVLPKKEKEETPLTKSILSKKPTPELSVVEPVRLKPQRKEISEGIQKFEYPVLRIPEPKLPAEFEYLKPVPTRKEIDLNKLNPLVNDPQVREIECEGANKPIVVYGTMGRMPTEIIFSASEIENIIDIFASSSKIPVEIGVYKVVVGNLIFSAVISDVVPSKFLITKMSPAPQFIRPQLPMPPRIQDIEYSSYIKK